MIGDLWVSILPAILVDKLGPVSFLVIGYMVEKNFVGRIATFSNSLAINLYVFMLVNPSPILIWYANIGIIMGLLAITTYGRQSLSKYFYYLSWAYCSVVVGVIILLTGL